MIDLQKARKDFKEYASRYDLQEGKIKLKIAHMERTAILSRKIAESLHLSQEQTSLAELIGLLHDIGRFEQIKRYNTFIDHLSVNHGMLGADLLFQDGLIRNFIEDRSYDTIIEKAIRNHNRSYIEENLSKDELLQVKIIRDSDKTDILYLLGIEDTKSSYNTEDITKEEITKQVYEDFIHQPYHKINYEHVTSGADNFVCQMAFIFDYHFCYGLKLIKEKDYLRKILRKVDFKLEPTKSWAKEIYEITKKQIEEKVK